MSEGGSPTDEVLVETRGAAGSIVLNRPKALNALNLGMVRQIGAALDAFAADSKVRHVVIKSSGGRAFCAGGDIRALYEWGRGGRHADMLRFWREEYELDWRIARYSKPVIALADGLVMGGGVGLFLHASHRVTTEAGSLTMPEVGIGFFPDVGATFELSRLPNRVGALLAVTGLSADAGDMRALRLATHGVPRARLAELETALCERTADDALVSATEAFGPSALVNASRWIASAFAAPTRQALLSALESRAEPLAVEAARALRQKSPCSQAIALRQILSAAGMTLRETLQQDFRIVSRIGLDSEFLEGVRAAVIDKDQAPRWSQADPDRVEEAFAPLGETELMLQDLTP